MQKPAEFVNGALVTVRVSNAMGELTTVTGKVRSVRKVLGDWDAPYGVMRLDCVDGQAFLGTVSLCLESIQDIAIGSEPFRYPEEFSSPR